LWRGRNLVYLVDLVHLVSFFQPNKRDKPNKPNNGLIILEDFFNSLLAPWCRHVLVGLLQRGHFNDFDVPSGCQLGEIPVGLV
jgi:hypothetical protein